MSRSSRKRRVEQTEPPAKILAGHVNDRHLDTKAGGPTGWRNLDEHVLTRAYYDKRIDADEFAAGEVYRAFYERRAKGGSDSLDMVPSGSTLVPFTQSQIDAVRTIQAIEANLRQPFPMIIRKFCGENYSATNACRAAGYDNPRDTWATIRIALSKLSAAISMTRLDIFGKNNAKSHRVTE